MPSDMTHNFEEHAETIIDFTALYQIGKSNEPCRKKWLAFLETDSGQNLLEEIQKQHGQYSFIILHDDNPEYTDPSQPELYQRRFHLVLRKRGYKDRFAYIDATPALAGDPHINFRTIYEGEYNDALDAVFGDINDPLAQTMKNSAEQTLLALQEPEQGIPVSVIAPPILDR